ncbi:restriction endonuclease subunit S [uncultured Selenomonas sp.]|uniref:restriction endonuclease subunit S n=1 Tax=uncultured Selenomonas sp. TaxID=159275 RepID=UPI0025F67876|nr:restriction endonuclease subunit S [uncultured Selenomonas sp.]
MEIWRGKVELLKKYAADADILAQKIIDAAMHGNLTEQRAEDGTADEILMVLMKKLEKKRKLKISLEELSQKDIPDTWRWCRLSDIGTTNVGLTYHPEDVKENGTVVLRSTNIQDGRMDYSDIVKVDCPIRENQYLNPGDILICARNGSPSLVGKSAIYDGSRGKVAFGAFMAVFRSECNPYLSYYFQSRMFRRYFVNDDTKQIHQITQKILKDAIVPLPPLAEQRRIVQKLQSIFSALLG